MNYLELGGRIRRTLVIPVPRQSTDRIAGSSGYEWERRRRQMGLQDVEHDKDNDGTSEEVQEWTRPYAELAGGPTCMSWPTLPL